MTLIQDGAQMVDFMVKKGWPKPNEYDDWQEMYRKKIWGCSYRDAFVDMRYAEGSLNAGKHVL